MHAIEHAREVDCDDPVPSLGRHIEEVTLRIVDSGAVHQDIDPADALRRLGHGLLVADVERDRLAAADSLDRLLGRGERVVAAARDPDAPPAARELEAAGESDSRAAAGDPGGFSL